MKKDLKLNYLLALALVFSIFSCNNDDDDDNTLSPEIVLENLNVTIDENQTNGQVIGAVQTNSDGTLNYSISSQTPTGALSINENTGELSVADASLFDYETNPVITATISVVGATNTSTVTVTLSNLDETSVQDLTIDFDENPTNGDTIGTLAVTGNGTLNFSITDQTPVGAVDINTNTGEITVADATLFDFEVNPVITANISVENSGNIESAMATVNLNNLNELIVEDLEATIDENPIDGQSVGSITADGDGTISFSIASQTPTGALSINANTGELTVIDPNLFDFETNPIITATIDVDNSGNMLTAVATINLIDVDEITVQDLDVSINENLINGATIGTITATGGGNLNYSITFQNPVGAFNIDENTGEISVADETLFDFETNPNMLATISVNNGVSSVSANAFVALNDVNEIGEFKYGGVIFWIDPSSNNNSGLVCAITDEGANVAWGCQGTFISGTSVAIGSGAANTAIIVSGCNTLGIAADIASNTTIGTFSDWFLPSRSELNQMYLQRTKINATAIANGGTEFIANSSTRYWSSSESNNNTAWCKYFINGNDAGLNKNASGYFQARVVRAFTDF
ncbi:DUF1566 domain-containing protein [Kriegella sp. EG-1]|nr:DUF1566 domain-containing protein [Flavobacteriaceae bacterium EG-1]